MATVHPSADRGVDPGDRRIDDSRWWYWIAAVPVMTVLSMLVVPFVVLFILWGLKLTLWVTLLVVLVVALPALVVQLMLPVALYKEIDLIRTSGLDWDPDQELYLLLGVLGVFVQLLGLGVAVYYLYQRHTYLGTP